MLFKVPKLKVKRGLEKDLPKLDEGELGFTKDTKRFFVGGDNANVEFAKQELINELQNDMESTNRRFDDLQLVDANAEVLAARGGEEKLADRLDKQALQLAEKASIVDVDTKIANMGSASPKGVYATLSSLQTAYPTGTTGIYLVTADGKWYYWNGSAWTVGGTYQATGIADGVIVHEKTNFASVILTTANLFNKDTVTAEYNLSTTDGTLYAKAAWVSTDFIVVKPNTVYTSNSNDRIVEYDANKVFVKSVIAKTITTGATAKYIRVSASNTYLTTLMVVEGSTVPTPYQPYSPKTKIDKLYLDPTEIKSNLFTQNVLNSDLKINERNSNFLYRNSNNLFDKSLVTSDYRLSNTGAVVSDTNNTISDFIEVKPSTAYSCTEGSYTCQYDANKQYITGHTTGITTFTTDANAKYIKTTVRKVIIDAYMFAEGSSVPSVYVPYNVYAFNSNIQVATTAPRYQGKTWNVLGDSITEQNYSYWSVLAGKLGVTKVNNYGVGGTAIAVRPSPWDTNAMCLRYNDMVDADIITVLGGTNDFGSSQVNLGTMVDRGTDTFYGACHTLYGGLVNKYPTKTIAVFTMPPRYNMQTTNGKGYTVYQFADVIKEVCAYYGIPVLDILRNSQLRPYNDSNKTAYIPDGLHPNTTGHSMLANQMLPFMQGL